MKNKIKITEPQLKMLQESFNNYNKPTESDKLLDYNHGEMSPEQIGQIFILAANVGIIRDSVQKYFTEFVQMWHTREEAQKHIELLRQMVDKEESGGEGDSMDSNLYNRKGGENLNEEISRIKKMMGIINEQAFNDDGEPMMTHQQYNDYSEPSEPDYDDNYDDDNHNEDTYVKDMLEDDLKKSNIFLETFDGEEYFIRCYINFNDFLIYFEGENIKIHEYNSKTEEEKNNTFNYKEALDYILSKRDLFYSYEESAKARDRDYEEDARDRNISKQERNFGA